MNFLDESLAKDIERVQQIPIIATILNVICQTTGMGFAAVARVTQDRWIACSVRDDIHFGLVAGSELKLETTICNEIRYDHKPVVIDHVQENETFRNHPTPALYGFQSYVSYPIFLKTGEFFGTLCAIDPDPAQLDNERIKGMFGLFTDLIAFHLQQIELLEQSDQAVRNLSRQLTHSNDENRQYRHISNHSLQEPLRKLQLFSSMLVDAAQRKDVDKTQELAAKIVLGAQKFSTMIKDLTHFSGLSQTNEGVEVIDLNQLMMGVWNELNLLVQAKKATLQLTPLPAIRAIRLHIEELFYHLLHNALKFSRKEVDPIISIAGRELAAGELIRQGTTNTASTYLQVQIADNGIGIEASQLEKVFDMFAQVPYDQGRQGEGFGLTYCRKIVRQHGGLINAQSVFGQGTTVFVSLPIS
ncbi:GAF domain-containing protein [Spirosoma agri]|uniref:histidine kinase n=1 Tax=Spirosoma agri TaxID=1987381 RepID=A0A6M0IQJ3_9BACT|nr:ATP-binding protein [Spirosoma agri]NEU70187.1 GAF domain-containing protein [Spirosoma agri]